MRFLMLALTLAFSASSVSADIAWRAGEMADGTTMVMQDNRGTHVTHVKRGAAPGGFLFDVYGGKGVGPHLGSYVVNARGDILKTIAADGAETTFAPHRCNRTLGTCSYTMTHADGYVETRSRVTEATAKGLRYREYGLDGLMSEGSLELDHFGAAISGWRNGQHDQRKIRTKRILIALN